MAVTFEELFNHKSEIRDCELLTYEAGKIVVGTRVNESNCNPYGTAHGGYLFTLCDNTAGLLGYSLGHYVVTMNSSISFLKSVRSNEKLTVTAEMVHDGTSSKVCEVEIRDENGSLICKAMFTLFPVKKIEE